MFTCAKINKLNFQKTLLLLWLSLLVLLPVQAEQKKGPPKRLTPVVISEATEQFLSPSIEIPGTVISRQESELPAEVAGRLIWVADVGTKLQWGEPVARLDDTLYRLKAAENNANVQREKARLRYLEKEVVRLEELIKGDFSTKDVLDKMQLDRDVAFSELVVAKAKTKVDEETLKRYVVRAPFDGVVVTRAKREGEWINSGDTVLTLSNPKRLEIEARVNEKSVRFLKVGDKLTVYRGPEKLIGVVRTVVGIADEKSHLYDVRIDVFDKSWMAGQVVRVQVPTGKARKVLAVPRDALVMRRSGTSLFRLNDSNAAEKVNISTGIASGDFIQVEGNLAPGDRVVIRGGERLRPGQEVKVIPGTQS